MFDFLKKPTHHHPVQHKYQRQEEEPYQQFESPLKPFESLNILVAPQIKYALESDDKKPARIKKYQQNSPVKLNRQVEHQLKQMLQESQKVVNQVNAIEVIDDQAKDDKKINASDVIESLYQDYLYKLFNKTTITNNLVKQNLNDLIAGTVNSIADDIQNDINNYQVFKKKILTKQEMMQAQTANQLNAIKMKEGQISSKVGQLRMELNIIEDKTIISKAKQIIQKDTFSKDNCKTKQAEKFVQNKKLQRDQIERKKKEQKNRKKLQQLEEKILEEKQAQKAKSQRHAKLIQKFEAKQIQKQKRKQQVQSQKQKFSRFLKQYKNAKPLYQQKIEEHIKREIQERKARFQNMANRKNKYNPISFQQLQDFESKYLELKRELSEKKKIEMAIKRDQEKYRIQQMRDKHYKGKYRYLILEQMVNRQAKAKQQDFSKKILVEKKRAYSVDIKQKYKPKIDENKRIESQQFVSQTQRKYKQKGPRRVRLDSSDPNNLNTISYEIQEEQQLPDPKKQGQKYRRLLKQYIHDKVEKGEIKRPQTFESQFSVPTPKINYLKEQREIRETRNSSFSYQSLDADSRIKKIKNQVHGDVALFKLKAEELDQKARRQELKLKYAQHNPHDQKELQENYLASIKAKLELLNNVK